MTNDKVTRRGFLQGSGGVAGSLMLKAGLPAFIATSQAACSARDEGAPFENISADEAREIVAIAARILPTTDTPGATEAGAVYFFDKAFGTFFAELAVPARGMLAQFQAGVGAAYPGAERFSDLDEGEQDEYLTSVENTPFFQGAWFMTMAGVFGMSKHGGNRDNIGYQLVGMGGPPRAWMHPFGDYDAEVAGENSNGA